MDVSLIFVFGQIELAWLLLFSRWGCASFFYGEFDPGSG